MNLFLILLFITVHAMAEDFEVVGGCYTQGNLNVAAINPSDYSELVITDVPVANSDSLALNERQCQEIEGLNQALNYTALTMAGASLFTYALAGTDLNALILAAGVSNPVVVAVTILGGGVAYLVLKVNLDECERMSKRLLNEKVEQALLNSGRFIPNSSNIQVRIGE